MIATTIHDWTATIEVDDFSPLSRHDHAFARELRDAVVELSDHDEVKVIVLRARSQDFAPAATPDAVTVHEVMTSWHRDFAASDAIYQALCFSKKIVITEVAGDCMGAGSLLVLCSDLTVAADTARFGSPFTDLPEANFVLAALTIRLNRAKSWVLRRATFPAEEALAIGLVNVVAPVGDVAAEVAAMARAAAGMPLDGVTMSKMLLQAVLDGHGVGREFDLADQYAIHRWADRSVPAARR